MRSFYDSILYHMGRGYADLYVFSQEYSIIVQVQYILSYYSLNMDIK
jgi:hypothetical protein